MLHLAGVKQLVADGKPTGELAVPLDQIKQFRQLHSRCPGHPEHGETTRRRNHDRPAGPGLRQQRGHGDRRSAGWPRTSTGPASTLFDYNVYALCSDGDLMEGVGGEAASLAGHLKLSNLCWIYDDNHITIEGDTSLAFSEDVAARFAGLRLARRARGRRQRPGGAAKRRSQRSRRPTTGRR